MNNDRVLRPVPGSQSTDARQYQLNQLRRRFSACEGEEAGVTVLTFSMPPTDPDFPFEITALQCVLKVPHEYPDKGQPSLRVTNPTMERGYQINVECGFDKLVMSMPSRTLLSLFNELDKRLESLLRSDRAQTIKLVRNIAKNPLPPAPLPASMLGDARLGSSSVDLVPQHAARQLAEAQMKREYDVRQLEARMGRQHLFSKSADGLSFSVPLHVKPGNLPSSLQSFQAFSLFVPPTYNLEPCLITFADHHSEEANRVKVAFERHARMHPEMTLTAHVNHLAQNMHIMARESAVTSLEVPSPPSPVAAGDTASEIAQKETQRQQVKDRPHLYIVSRPPEWSMPRDGDDGIDSSDADNTEDESENQADDEDGGVVLSTETPLPSDATGPDRGVRLSFPSLELYGMELLQLSPLSLTVKCDRCKEVRDIKNIKPHVAGDHSLVKRENCHKCADQMSITYRPESMHANSVRAGYVDVGGCTVVDLLPSYFIPTCSQCSTPHPAPGVVSVRGESTMAMCRQCHQKMSFKIPDVKFLRVSGSAGARTDRPLPSRRRPKENLGIVSGQELPGRGSCQHYAKSYRWFRFSCCSKVYPCDRCHDATEEHPNEHANRMICGFCSREQTYRPEDCIHCHHSLVRKHASGFWEGGKGTRDRNRMSRKDPRKYKRQGVQGNTK